MRTGDNTMEEREACHYWKIWLTGSLSFRVDAKLRPMMHFSAEIEIDHRMRLKFRELGQIVSQQMQLTEAQDRTGTMQKELLRAATATKAALSWRARHTESCKL